nr:penicillin-binding protein 2 [Desulfobulbaceae bacterium]
MRQVISKIQKINEAELTELKRRVNIATLIILFFVMILVVRLWYLQILRGPDYVKLSENNRIRMQWVNAPRGNIWDRNGKEIVTNRPFFNVTWVREDAPNPDMVLKKMAVILKVDISELLERIREGQDYPRYVPIRLKEDIDWKTLVYIENHRYDLPGIRIEVLPSRKYIHDNLASHLIGYLGRINQKELNDAKNVNYQPNDHIGKLGIEKLYEDKLRGEKGQRYVEVDVQGFEQREIAVHEPLSGNDIKLTIDLDIQKAAEDALENKGGAVIVMEVNSGRLLAFASSPPLELEEFIGGISQKAWDKMQQNIMHPFLNKTVQGQYPPASTYKMVTALAGLSEGVINQDTIYYCAGSMMLHGRRYHCWKRSGHGAVSLVDALAQSCDVYFYQVGLKVGVNSLAKYARSLGFGTQTGINVEHEKPGLIPTTDWKLKQRKEGWQEGETMSVAIGQGFNLATPLQVCQMTATIANNGIRYRPQIIESIMDESGTITEKFEPIEDGRMLGDSKSLGLIKAGMLAVVNGERGTAKLVRLDGITVAGKTGTAQVVKLAQNKNVPEDEIPYKYRDHAWFTCYAPAEKPEIAVTVLVEHGLHGSSGAGPVAKLVLESYFSDRLVHKEKDKK